MRVHLETRQTAPVVSDVSTEVPDFNEIYRDEVAYVWRTLRRLGTRKADLEDLVQEVFSVVYRRLDSYDSERPMRSWLFGIAFRVSSDHRRRARHRYEISIEDREFEAKEQGQLKATEKRSLCIQALAEISLDQRAIVLMHDLDGYTAPEIADVLEIPMNTVYSRLRLGRAKFAMVVRRLSLGEPT